MLSVSTNDRSAAHFATSIPNGAINIPQIPIIITNARRGSLMISPCISSISRLPIQFSISPTVWNNNDLDTAWNIISINPAHTASGCPTPAQAVISPRLEIVEYASTFLPSLCEIARRDAAKKVNPPITVTITPVILPDIRGERRSNIYTPTLTIVAECNNALLGVGATMAPRSHLENGICALLTRAANANNVTGARTSGTLFVSIAVS